MARRRDDFPAPELPTMRRFSPSRIDISRLRMRVGLKSGVVRVRLWMESAACGAVENSITLGCRGRKQCANKKRNVAERKREEYYCTTAKLIKERNCTWM